MTLDIPYTFIAGTKAKANEVNENFLAVKQHVDQVEVDLLNLQNFVDMVDETYAKINGDSNQIFRVANAKDSYDAVNLYTLDQRTANTKNNFWGFAITKTGEKSIVASPGATYDSTLYFMIQSNVALTYEFDAMADNTTYYIYVCGEEDMEPVLTSSTNSEVPTVPPGYTYYKRIGYVVSDDDGNILYVYSYSPDGDVAQTIKDLMSVGSPGFIGPLYATYHWTTRDSGGRYTLQYDQDVEENLWVTVGWTGGYSCTYNVYIDSVEIVNSANGTDRSNADYFMFPIRKGQNLKIYGYRMYCNMFLMEYDGANYD